MRSPVFMQLLTSSQSRIYAYILSLVLHPDQADDILQKTNLVLWEKEDEFDLNSNFVAWAFRIAYFQVLAHRKQQQRDRLVFDDKLLGDLSLSASQADDTFEDRQRVLRQCLEKLSSNQKTCIRSRYHGGSTLQEIASQTNKKVNAIKQILFRARRNLLECVNSRIRQEVGR